MNALIETVSLSISILFFLIEFTTDDGISNTLISCWFKKVERDAYKMRTFVLKQKNKYGKAKW